jgi:hypothetical protein
LVVFHSEPCPEPTKYSLWLKGLTARATTLPPVIAGPMLLKDNPLIEIFFNESGSDLSCALIFNETKNRTAITEKKRFFVILILILINGNRYVFADSILRFKYLRLNNIQIMRKFDLILMIYTNFLMNGSILGWCRCYPPCVKPDGSQKLLNRKCIYC